MRHVGLLLAAAALVACSSDPGTGTDGPSDGGTATVITYANLSGTVQYHPQELRWRAAVGGDKANPPALTGSKLHVEDAIKAQSKLPPLKTVDVTVAQDGKTGTFVAEQVYVKGTTLALVASVEQPPPANADDDTLIFSGYGLGKPPFQPDMTDLPVFVVSKAFMTHLADVLERDLSTMLDEGVVIGGASDWKHTQGVAGAKLVRLYGTGATARIEEITENIFYFNEDLTGTVNERATTSSGMWVRLNAGSATTYTMIEKDATKYLQDGKKHFNDRLNGSRAGTALSVFFEDMSTPK